MIDPLSRVVLYFTQAKSNSLLLVTTRVMVEPASEVRVIEVVEGARQSEVGTGTGTGKGKGDSPPLSWWKILAWSGSLRSQWR